MKEERSYWNRVLAGQLSRRRILGMAGRAGMGLVGASLVGCAAAPLATPTPARAPAPGATATPRPGPTATPIRKVIDSLTVATQEDSNTTDPHYVSGIGGEKIMLRNMYDTLTFQGRNVRESTYLPGLATSWKTLNDTTWEFKLRQGVKFHNGEEFDAETVKWNLARIMDPQRKTQRATLVAGWEGVEVADKFTIRVITKGPDPLVLGILLDLPMMPAKYTEAKGDQGFVNEPVGSGPYKFVRWAKDDVMEMVAVEGGHWRYGGGNPPSRKLTFKPIPNTSARIAALKTGAVDVAYNVPYDLIADVEKVTGLKVLVTDAISNPTIYISLYEEGPLRDKRVRQALNYAVNRDNVVKNLLFGFPELMPSALAPVCFGYDSTIEPYRYNPQKAKELLAEAGYPNGFPIKLYQTSAEYPRYEEYIQALAYDLGQVGVKVTITPVKESFSSWASNLRKKGTGPDGLFHTSAGCGSMADADYIVRRYYTTWDDKTGIGSLSYISNSELDKLAAAARNSVNAEERKKLYAQALRIIKEEAYAIPLWTVNYTWGYNATKVKLYPRFSSLYVWDAEAV